MTEPHPDAHPEAHSQLDEVENVTYGQWGRCVGKSKRSGVRCKSHAKGPHGKCHTHGGATPKKDENPDVGAPENNGNAAKHNLTSDPTKLYERLSDEQKDVVDRETDAMLEDIAERRGIERAPTYLTWPARRVAMNFVRIIWFAEDWEAEAASSTGNPLVDESLDGYSEAMGGPIIVEKPAVVEKVASKLSSENRQWLKDMGLLDSPEDRLADAHEDVAGSMMSALKEAYDK